MPATTQGLRPIDILKNAVRKGLLKKSVKLANGDYFDVYYRVMTQAEQQSILNDCGDDAKLSDYRLQVFLRRALDANGQKLFTKTEAVGIKDALDVKDLEALVSAVCDDQGVPVDMKSPQGSASEG